jgi:hydroxymethylglutaryl-CoA reductase
MNISSKPIAGFSKLSRAEKLQWLEKDFNINGIVDLSNQYLNTDSKIQEIHDGFSENTITNFLMPYGIAPNFLIDGVYYAVPMVIEESSVVAAASSAAKFWEQRGGFHTEVISTTKVGHISFRWSGSLEEILNDQENIIADLEVNSQDITANMEKRGGGLIRIEFIKLEGIENIFQLKAHFNTCDSMGANFINTALERYASCLKIYFNAKVAWRNAGEIEIIMSILSNYTPECVVKAWVSCEIEKLKISQAPNDDVEHLANKFKTAVDIAKVDPFRATTHNKGIYNGIDAVVLATGNDFRAVEAAGHAYAARNGKYASLSSCTIDNGVFTFMLEIPLAIGTIGGLTSLHPMAKKSLEILGNPSAEKLMSIIASVGLAQNFAALRSLVTTGIQKGHMKMHLQNILTHLEATPSQKEKATIFFADKVISYSDVRVFLETFSE